MSIFGKIMSAIFGTKATAAPAGAAPASATPPSGGAAAGATASGGSPAAAPAAAQTVDVAPILDKAVAAKGEKLEWRTSIVDLMKALDIDSSFTARKELAKELGYTGDSNDSASMNIWLHRQVMAKLAANGGKLPPEIKH
jgi:zona occludens toxin (predicted ATPase)